MIFNQQVTTIQSQVLSNAATIESLQARIEQLREEDLKLETHLQALGTAEAASQSAVEQLRTAIALVRAIDPSQLEVLHTEVENLFEPVQGVKLIEASIDNEPEPEPTPPTEPTTPPTTDYQETTDDYERYNNLSYNQIKNMAQAQGISIRQGKRPYTKQDLIRKILNRADAA